MHTTNQPTDPDPVDQLLSRLVDGVASPADDLDFVGADALESSLVACEALFSVFERNRRFRNLEPYGEPQLGSRGLYRATGGGSDPGGLQTAMLWVLNLSDGEHDLISIAERSGVAIELLDEAAELLQSHGLLAETEGGDPECASC